MASGGVASVVGGRAGSPGTSGIGGVGGGKAEDGQPAPNIDGEWALLGFEDPLAVQLTQSHVVLTGIGCLAGLASPRDASPPFPCHPIVDGTIVGNRVHFAFEPYSTDVTASANGDRMTGTLNGSSGHITWLRVNYPDPWLANTAGQGLREAVEIRARAYGLIPAANAPASGPDFVPNQTYRFSLSTHYNFGGQTSTADRSSPMVTGDLGAFWATEMSWQENEQILTVGPVSPTAPELPVSLTLRFNGLNLGEVEAIMPSGTRYQFQALPFP